MWRTIICQLANFSNPTNQAAVWFCLYLYPVIAALYVLVFQNSLSQKTVHHL